MSRSIVLLCLFLLPGCPDDYGTWMGGCPSWEPERTTCLEELCEADVEAGQDPADSWACREVDAAERAEAAEAGEEPADTSDTGP